MSDSSVYRSTTTQSTARLLDAVRFDRAAMFVGRPLYWGVSPEDHVAGMTALIQWCLGLPGARLGVSVSDVATIVRDMTTLSSSALPMSPDLQQLLSGMGVNPQAATAWALDSDVWNDHLSKLGDWMEQAAKQETQGNEFFWVDPKDTNWWITATMRSLAGYSTLFWASAESEFIFRLISRHVGTVFAPFNGGATWDHLIRLFATLPPEQQQRFQGTLTDPRLDRAQLAEIRGVYWSWRLTDFANADGSIVCTPMLALWSEWPSSASWAPPSLADVSERRQFTSDEAAFFLEDTLWQRIESIFSIARNFCGLGVAEPEFAGKESRPSVFFFAAPTDVPIRPEEYAEDLRPAIMPLVRSCLLSADPLADQVAWGLLEGDLVALRREISDSRSYQPRYLLLPTSTKSPAAQPIEEDIGSVANRLTFLEFSISHEGRDVSTDVEPLAVRAGTWGGTLDLVNGVTGEAIDLLPSVHRSHLGRIYDRLTGLHLIIRRLQTSIETAASDANQVVRKYNAYLDSTDDYFRLRLPSSAVPRVTTLNLRDAIQNAYPYQYLKQPVKALETTMSQLNSSVARISSSLNTILDLSDRRIRLLSSRLGGLFNFIIALLALLVGLAQVLGAQAGASANPSTTASNGFLSSFFQSPEVASAARLLFELVGLVLIAAAILYGGEWIRQRLPRRRHKFIEELQRFRALVSAAEKHVATAIASGQNGADLLWQSVDLLDDEAVIILGRLWKDLRRGVSVVRDQGPEGARRFGRRIRPQSVREWELRARLLEHAIELFDLSPRAVLLPRALCVLRFKSTDFQSRTTISDWDFGTSLRALGYSFMDVNLLTSWLSSLANQRQIQIRDWDVVAFAESLKAHGVSAVPSKRTPERWNGLLTRA